MVDTPVLKNLAKQAGVRPPFLAPLGDWGFLGEETTLRGEFSFPERCGRQSAFHVILYIYHRFPHCLAHTWRRSRPDGATAVAYAIAVEVGGLVGTDPLTIHLM